MHKYAGQRLIIVSLLNHILLERLLDKVISMRKRYDRIKWNIQHIEIRLPEIQSKLAASKYRLTKDEFIDSLVDFLIEDGYSPKLPIDLMRKRLHRPCSESESYIFLKINDDGTRLKLVLDIGG